MSFLLLFYIKKKLSVIPIGTNASWAQWHYYVGIFLIVVFLIHIEFSIPDGYVEGLLTCLLGLVVSVGILGAIINRVMARRLAYLDEEIIFERIPEHRQRLKERVETELMASVEMSKSPTLSNYYVENLADYFSSNQDVISHLLGSRHPHVRRTRNLELQMRYLNDQEAEFASKLVAYLEQKNTLDSHNASQGLMKYWGVLHAPIGLMMFIVMLAHIVLVYAFRGAA